MRLKAEDESSEGWKVYFNGKWAPYIIEADDKEGWISVIDHSWLTKLAEEGTSEEGDPEPVEIKTKKLYGEVRFEQIK